MPGLLQFCSKATCHVTYEIPCSKFNAYHSKFAALHIVLKAVIMQMHFNLFVEFISGEYSMDSTVFHFLLSV
jgi:hypothetical protein